MNIFWHWHSISTPVVVQACFGGDLDELPGWGLGLYIKMSKNTKINLPRKGRNRLFMADWNVDGAFDRPKGITRNS